MKFTDSNSIFKFNAMNRLKNYLLLLLSFQFLNFSATLLAQELRLTEAERREFEARTLIKINEFQANLSIVASRDKDTKTKQIHKEVILELFLKKGDGVTMEVSYLNPTTKQERRKRYPLIDYMNRLANLPYDKVEMKRAESCRVSSFRQSGRDANGNAIYSAVATYYQEFIGYNAEGKPIYRDITQKNVEVQLGYSTDTDVPRWIILLGDVSVKGTKI